MFIAANWKMNLDKKSIESSAGNNELNSENEIQLKKKKEIGIYNMQSQNENNLIELDKTLEMDGMIGTLEMVASSDWCAILPAVLCDLDILGNLRTLSPLTSPNLITEYVLITSASKELSSAAKLFSKKMCDEIKSITEKI